MERDEHSRVPKPAHSEDSSFEKLEKTEILLVDIKVAEVLKKLGLVKDKTMP